MMFDLNPYGDPNALWQHSLMFLGAAALGAMIAVKTGSRKIRELKHKVTRLNQELKDQTG